MALQESVDYVFVPRVTLTHPAAARACLIGLQDRLYTIPYDFFESSAGKAFHVRYSLAGKSVDDFLLEHLQERELNRAGLEAFLHKLLVEDMSLELANHCIQLDGLSAFKVKDGWFSRGVYYKKPGQMGYRGFAVSGKEQAQKLMQFYSHRMSL